MATKLDKTIKREIEMDGQPYMVAIAPEGVKMTQKGYRKGREITWRELWSRGTEEGGSGGAGGGGSTASRGSSQNTGGSTPPSDPSVNPPGIG